MGRNQMYSVEEIKNIVAPIARAYGVKKLSLFGSYARGDARPDSDLDFRIIEGTDGWGWFKLADFWENLKDSFSVSVDLVDCEPTAQEFLDEIKSDEVIIYEQ